MDQQKSNIVEVYERFSDLPDHDLSNKDLRGYDLTGVNLKGAKLIEANLSGAILKLADFTGADLRLADLTNAALEGANFKRANLSGAKLNGAKIRETNFEDANLTVAERDADWWIGLLIIALTLLLLFGTAWFSYTAGYYKGLQKKCVQANIECADSQK